MWRRVARALRFGLLVLGMLILLSIPASLMGAIEIYSPWPGDITGVNVSRGFIWVLSVYNDDDPPFVIRFRPIPDWEDTDPMDAIRPWVEIASFSAPNDSVEVVIPLWLLAAVCLAWPATSFLIARRRGKRGFPVEPRHEDSTPSLGA